MRRLAAAPIGHGSLAMVEKVYAHLGQVRARAEVLEYRAEQHVERLGDRLQAVQRGRFGTTADTTA